MCKPRVQSSCKHSVNPRSHLREALQTAKPPPPPQSHRENGSSHAAGNDSSSTHLPTDIVQEGMYALAVVRLADVSHAEMVELNVTEGNSTYAVSSFSCALKNPLFFGALVADVCIRVRD